MASLTDKEFGLLKAALGNVEGGDSALMKLVDFEKVHEPAEYKDAANAKEMFRRLLIKLKGGAKTSWSKASKSTAKPKGITKAKAEGVKRGRGRPKNSVQDDNPKKLVRDNNGTDRATAGSDTDEIDDDTNIKGEEVGESKAVIKEEASEESEKM